MIATSKAIDIQGTVPHGDEASRSSVISPPSSLIPSPSSDYLPARMLNEFTYCPRLFYYEHVDGLFAHNQETVEGELRHSGLDARQDGLPPPEQLAETGRQVRSRSVTLSSDTYGVIAKMDLIEADGQRVTPVDYKRGRPREAPDGSIQAWDTDQTQLAVQALVLREHGYTCDEAIVYYVATKQRVRIPIDAPLVESTLATIRQARQTAAGALIPPPLADSPKCPRCSLVAICLPDETNLCTHGGGNSVYRVQKTLFPTDSPRGATTGSQGEPDQEIRRLVPARDDLRPLYLNTQGLSVGKSGEVLKIKDKDKVIQEVRLKEICQLNLLGNIQVTTQAIQTLCEADIPIAYFSMGGWFYGITQGLGVKNIFLRREQFRLADVPAFCLRLARALVAGKIANQRTLLQRNHVEPPASVLAQMKCLQQETEHADSLDTLLGLEGNAARLYFENLPGMLKVSRETRAEEGSRESSAESPEPDGSAAALDSGLSSLDSPLSTLLSRLSLFPSTLRTATAGRRGIRSTRCCRWRTACWPRT